MINSASCKVLSTRLVPQGGLGEVLDFNLGRGVPPGP